MKSKLFDYIDRDNVIYNLSGLTKLICFIAMTFAVMFSYDIRFILCVMALSAVIFAASGLEFTLSSSLLLILCLPSCSVPLTEQKYMAPLMRYSVSAKDMW